METEYVDGVVLKSAYIGSSIEFTSEEKAEFFDEIAACFYNKNFGRMSKSDIELLMFHFYIEKLISDNQRGDGTIDYRDCSDYKISNELGITQQRVRNLKVKNQLVYPIEYDWRAALAKLTENARYDKITRKVTLNIPDPNLYLEIQNYIENRGAYIEKQLNSRVLELRAEYYIDLAVSLEDDTSRKGIIKKLKQHFKAEGKDDTAFDEKNIGKSLTAAALNVSAVAADISSLISSPVGVALTGLLTRAK